MATDPAKDSNRAWQGRDWGVPRSGSSPDNSSQESTDRNQGERIMTETEPITWTVPEGGYTGFPAFVWWIRRLVHRDKAVPPKPNRKQLEAIETAQAEQAKRDAAEAAQRELDRREAEYIVRVNELADEVKHATFVGVQSKGNGATSTTMANLACLLGWVTRTLVVVADLNPAEGTCAALLGKDYGATANVKQLSEDREHYLASPRSYIEMARPNRYNVRVVAALSTVEAGQNPLHEADKVAELISDCQEHFEFVFVDTPNVLTNEVGLATVSTGNVLVFTANVPVLFSLRQLGTSMQSLRVNGLKEKVEHSVVVISNLQPEDELEGFRKFMNRLELDDSTLIKRFDQDFEGRFKGIPHDPIIARDIEVEVEAWNQQTRLAYYDALIAALEQALDERKLAQKEQPTQQHNLPVPPELAAQNGHSTELAMTHHQGGNHD